MFTQYYEVHALLEILKQIYLWQNVVYRWIIQDGIKGPYI